MNGFPILRVAGILLGGISLVLLSRPAFGIQFADAFEAILDVLGDNLNRFFKPLEYWVVVPVIEWLRSFNLNIPHPAPYWHHAFVLLWLMQGAIARGFSLGEGWGNFLILFIWGGLTALVTGAATGTVPLNSEAMMIWPVAGVFALGAGISLPLLLDRRDLLFGLLAFAAAAAFAAYFAYAGYAATKPMTSSLGLEVPSPGLLWLAAMVGGISLSLLFIGLLTKRSNVEDTLTNIGLDVLGAYGVAITIAAIGLSVPG